MSQCFYYRGFTLSDAVKHPEANRSMPDENRPLLIAQTAADHTAANGIKFPPDSTSSSRRSSSTIREHLAGLDGTRLSPATPMHPPQRDTDALSGQTPARKSRSTSQAIIFNLAAILVVCAAGVLGWYLSNSRIAKASLHSQYSIEHDHRTHQHDHNVTVHFDVLGQVFGYVCAILYLGSRIPQLLLNYRRKSTDGVSMLFFLFACIGNATYVMSILAYEPSCLRGQGRHGDCAPGEARMVYGKYMLVNLSWLIGSFGTLILDLIVFVQYGWYRDQRANEEAVEE